MGALHSLQVESDERGFPLVDVFRGEQVESVHSVAACIARASGEIIYSLGAIDFAYPLRSSAKLWMAAEIVRSGTAERFAFTSAEIALSAASHDGEKMHRDAVAGILKKIGLDENALACGPAMEGPVVVGPPIANGCSGKHAAVLALCKHLDYSPKGYLDKQHPVQQWLMPRVCSSFGFEWQPDLLTDGCGMPIFSATLRQAAIAVAKFGTSVDPAILQVRSAMTHHPALVGGSNNLDSAIISATEGAVIGKIGAEGMHLDALTQIGLGAAVKVIDGNSRALGPGLCALFARFGNLSLHQKHQLETIAVKQLRNAAGALIGTVSARPLPLL